MSSLHSLAALNGTNGALTSKEKLELVERVANSPAFARSPALQAFLLYIAKHAIAERPERIKEQSIGAEVLGRKPNYDPAEDNIVRVRAHELRHRLEKYFATDGIDEPVIITVPRGTYVPEFHSRQDLSLSLPVPGMQKPEPRPEKRLTMWPWVAGSIIALVVIAAFISISALRNKRTTVESQASNVAIRDFWGQFFTHPEEELRVVTADTAFALLQDLSGQNLDLGDYLSRKYLQISDEKLREIAVRRATSPADVTISLQLSSLAKEFHGHINQQYARDIGMHALQSGNVAIIGSHRSNPWIEVFEPQLNFVLEQDARTGAPRFRNKSPHPGEAAMYGIPAMLDTNGTEQREIESYGLVALRRGCNSHNLIVLLEGLNMEATEAAGEVVTDPQRLNDMLHKIGHQPGTDVAPFEALIKLTSLPGGFANPEVIAYRIEPGVSCKSW